MAEIRVIIADDHPVFRSGLRALLETAGFDVVGEASNGEDVIEVALETAPDVVLMDLHMPGGGGAMATERILRHNPDVRVLVLTMLDDDAALHSAMRAGASGYLLKDTEQAALLRAISAVAAGEAVFGAAIAGKVLAHLSAGQRPAALAFPLLTPREIDVLDLVARGEPNPVIARRLQLTDKTVRNHLSNILVKLHAADRAQAIVLAREAGLGRRSTRPAQDPG